jgi:hypothetical protein
MRSVQSNGIPSRREFLAGPAGLGTSVIFPQAPLANARRIDVHHFGSPAWIAITNSKKTQGYQTWQPYTPARAIEDMDRGGVATALISITTPGIWFGNLEETHPLKMMVGTSQIVSGTDHPFGNSANIAAALQKVGLITSGPVQGNSR